MPVFFFIIIPASAFISFSMRHIFLTYTGRTANSNFIDISQDFFLALTLCTGPLPTVHQIQRKRQYFKIPSGVIHAISHYKE